MDKQYPAYYKQLTGLMGSLGKEIPNTMAGFGELHKQSMMDGVLSAKVKELIALAIAITVRSVMDVLPIMCMMPFMPALPDQRSLSLSGLP